MNKPVTATMFVLKKILAIAVIAGLCIAGFLICMNVTNFYVLLNDGFKERADVIIYGEDTDEMSKYFSNYFMTSDSYEELAAKYEKYEVYSYGYKLNVRSMLTWPWSNRTEVYVDEAVYSLDGEIDTAYMSRAEAEAQGVLEPPAWANATYKVVLIKQDGRWYIDEMTYVKDFEYEPPEKRSVAPEVLASLRVTPTPEATASPTAPVSATGSASASPDNARYGVVRLNGAFESLNVRSGPGTEYDIAGNLVENDRVKLLELEDSWYKIEFDDGKIGYASAKYIQEE